MNASGPSLDRIEAWRYNLRSLKKPDYTYPVIQEKLKHEESSSTEDNTESDSESDSDKTILVTPANSNQEPRPVGVDPPEDCPVPKGQFHTKTFGVKKPASPVPKKCKRNYPCKECDLNFTNMTEFNQHYKDHHKPVECKDCGLSFNTPSSLKRHAYTHKELKYACPHCGKKFPFSSDRDVHAIKHETVKQFVCKKCKKDFFVKSDLIKHEKMHLKLVWKCTHCEYTTNDERNLKAHQCHHSNLMPYMCSNCLALFRYHTQWKRHTDKPCPKEDKLEQSSDSASTEY